MSRRTWAGLLALVLVLGLSVAAALKPVPYATFAPGPTVNVLGKDDGKPIIQVTGHKEYRDKGGLRLVTIIPSAADQKVDLLTLMAVWLSPSSAAYPYSSIYTPQDTSSSVQQQSAQQMTSSQDNAVAAALTALKVPFTGAVKIAQVDRAGAAHGKLKTGDVVQSVNGKRASTPDELVTQVKALPIGSKVTLVVERAGRERTVVLTTKPSTVDAKRSAIGVSIAPTFDFPFQVSLNIRKNIGGPSGGLMFALGIYDVLTPGSLTGGKTVAGTGEIDGTGKVGPIGGVQQKIAAAQRDDAGLFLVPAANCAEAAATDYDKDKLRLVKVENFKDALADVKAWVQNPRADLPRCTR